MHRISLAERSLVEENMEMTELYYLMTKIKMLLHCYDVMGKADSRITKNGKSESHLRF